MRSIEMSARTVEAAVEAACEALGVSRDDLNVSYEVLEFPARKFFKTIPAKVRVTVEEPAAPEAPEAPAAPAPAPAREEAQLSLGDAAGQEALDRLRAASLDTMSPIEAMNLLYELKRKLEG